MGMQQPNDLDTSWDRAAEFLDDTFPLAEGSHREATEYLVQFDHLLVIREDGSCTGLARAGQFVEAGGNIEAPRSILLEHEGLQVEIEPCTRRAKAAGLCREHRLQLLTAVAA